VPEVLTLLAIFEIKFSELLLLDTAAGNNLDNACVLELLQLLSRPEAPCVTQLDLSMNTSLSWQCTRALSMALGGPLTAQDSVAGSGEDAGALLKVSGAICVGVGVGAYGCVSSSY
jgi:hypothetical protein